MPINTKCPTCEKPYLLDDAQSGKRVRCKHCADSFLVPESGSDEPAVSVGVPVEEKSSRSSRTDRDRNTEDRRTRRDRREDDRPTSRRSRPDTSPTPVVLIVSLIVGIPVVLIGLVMVVFFVAFSASTPRQPVAPRPFVNPPMPNFGPNPPPGFPFADPGLVPNAVAQPAPPVGVPGKKMVDLIGYLNPTRDAIDGRRWTIANNALHCPEGNFVPRIQIPYQPPEEYDFLVTFSQPGLRNGISLIMPNPNGGSFFWFLGSNGGTDYGFASNPNKEGRVPGLIQPNTAYTTTVQVRRTGVKGLLDGKELLSHQTNFRDLTCDGWRTIPDTRLLAVACDDPTVFHHVRVVEITGRGKRIR